VSQDSPFVAIGLVVNATSDKNANFPTTENPAKDPPIAHPFPSFSTSHLKTVSSSHKVNQHRLHTARLVDSRLKTCINLPRLLRSSLALEGVSSKDFPRQTFAEVEVEHPVDTTPVDFVREEIHVNFHI
jgi:hypothetical protein